MRYDQFNHIVKAEINGEIVTIDLAGSNRNDYNDLRRKITYLGKGRYYSYNGVPADDPKDAPETHFWRFE